MCGVLCAVVRVCGWLVVFVVVYCYVCFCVCDRLRVYV